VRREGEFSVGLGAQAFFFKATAHATQVIDSDGIQPLV
jgi:hypothetical protein